MAENKKTTKKTLSPEEKRALLTEAERNLAEAERHRKEAEFLAAQTENENISTAITKLQLEEAERQQAVARSVDAANRIYDFTEPVDADSVYRAMHTLSAWTRQNQRPITIRFNSPGGSVLDGFALYDYIRAVSARDEKGNLVPADAKVERGTGIVYGPNGKPVLTTGVYITTTALGMAASMAGVLLQAGNRRVVAPNAWVLVHDIQAGSGGSLQKMKDDMRFIEALQSKLHDILTERSTITKDDIIKLTTGHDYWMDPVEVLKHRLADAIGYS